MEVVEYMQRNDGTRALGVTVDGVQITLTPNSESQKLARQIAQRIVDAELDARAQKVAIDGLQHANEKLAARVRELRAQLADAETRIDAALTGKRRLFGRVLLLVETNGETWLMQPEKRESGFALRFDSLAECRRAHPELWPTGEIDGGCVVMDGLPL